MSDGDLIVLEDKTGGLLGRHVWHDPQNNDYLARGSALAAPLWAAGQAPKTTEWNLKVLFDQKRTSSCVKQGGAYKLNARPFNKWVGRRARWRYDTFDERYQGYLRALKYDPFDGEDPNFGTSTDAVCKMYRAEGTIAGWRWCKGPHDVKMTLSWHGPVGIGVEWREGMMQTTPKGYVWPTGALLGGHYVIVRAWNEERRRYTARNSWGPWGIANTGDFYIHETAMDDLLAARGEAVTFVA